MIQKKWFNGIANFIALMTLFSSQNIPSYAQGHSGRGEDSDLNVTLLEGAECTNFARPAYGRSTGVIRKKRKVSIGRELYTAPYSISSMGKAGSATLTCKTDPLNYRFLRLRMGISDNASKEMKITIHLYQGGSVKETHHLTPGKIKNTILDLSNPKINGKAYNVAIETVCQMESGFCKLFLLKSELVHISNLPK